MANWNPSNLATESVCWLDANAIIGLSNNDEVTSWLDQSSNSNDATEVSSSYNPVYKTNVLDSKPVVRFTADVLHFVAGAGFETTPAFTYFVVASRDTTLTHTLLGRSATAYQFLDSSLGWYVGGAGAAITRAQNTPQIYVGQLVPGANGAKRWLDGTQEGSTLGEVDAIDTDYDFRYFGAYSSTGSWVGDVAELVVLDYAADTSTRQHIEGYLAWKWGLESSLPSSHPYKVGAPFVMSGGGIVGGSAEISYSLSHDYFTMSGGAIAGGEATTSYHLAHDYFSMTGGAVVGGEAENNSGFTLSMDGGGVVGGEANVNFSFMFDMIGGGIGGGSATIITDSSHLMLGGGVGGGDTTITRTMPVSLSGSIGYGCKIYAVQWLNSIKGTIGYSGKFTAYQESSCKIIVGIGFGGSIGITSLESLSLHGSIGYGCTINIAQDDRLSIRGTIGFGGSINIVNQNLFSINGSIGYGAKINIFEDVDNLYSLSLHNSTRWA